MQRSALVTIARLAVRIAIVAEFALITAVAGVAVPTDAPAVLGAADLLGRSGHVAVAERTGRVFKIALSTAVALVSVVVVLALALAGHLVTDRVHRALRFALTARAVRKREERRRTLSALRTGEVLLARTLHLGLSVAGLRSLGELTLFTGGAVDEAVARPAGRVVHIAERTAVTVRRVEVLSTFALTSFGRTIARVVRLVTLTFRTDLSVEDFENLENHLLSTSNHLWLVTNAARCQT